MSNQAIGWVLILIAWLAALAVAAAIADGVERVVHGGDR
jgi:hypothetical protein